MRSGLFRFPSLLFIIALAFISCSSSKKITSSEQFYFYRCAQPNPSGKNYSIKVGPREIYLSIKYKYDSLDARYKLTDADLTKFAAAVQQLQITQTKEFSNPGNCMGGTTHSLELNPGVGKPVKGHIYKCGGSDRGNLKGDVLAAAELFNAIVPELSKKMEEIRKRNKD